MFRRPDFEALREQMVRRQLAARDIHDERVLAATRAVPRQRFVPRSGQRHAYEDRPLGIGRGQTISQPYIVALMTQLLELQGDERVLEIGTGSGYQAALLAQLAAEVYTIERHAPLAERATGVLAELGMNNVQVHVGDGSLGWPDAAPYNAIIATAAAPRAPQALLDQLADGGRLVLPVGAGTSQILQRWRRKGEIFTHEDIVPVAFVPLIGEQGWSAP
jgi:protein-L-isoaspartate(D-aspartate) O-methyltransferase